MKMLGYMLWEIDTDKFVTFINVFLMGSLHAPSSRCMFDSKMHSLPNALLFSDNHIEDMSILNLILAQNVLRSLGQDSIANYAN